MIEGVRGMSCRQTLVLCRHRPLKANREMEMGNKRQTQEGQQKGQGIPAPDQKGQAGLESADRAIRQPGETTSCSCFRATPARFLHHQHPDELSR
jgi:hypothetical protein